MTRAARESGPGRRVHVLEFNPVDPLMAKRSWTLVHRDHRKLLIVDGKTAFTGGINITADYERGISGRPRGAGVPSMWRDTDVEIQGPSVADLQRLLVDHWVKQTGDLLPNANYFHLSGISKETDRLVPWPLAVGPPPHKHPVGHSLHRSRARALQGAST
jgi:phosphatidylserine/phosphatidylglycerophosphate/cardiolipin synthase-like enzyme